MSWMLALTTWDTSDPVKELVLRFLLSYGGIAGGVSFLVEGLKALFKSQVDGREPVLVIVFAFVLGSAAKELMPGVYGIANAGLDEPWPKTVRLKTVLADWLAGTDRPEALFDGLAEEVPEDHGLASIFIRNPVYGTRCSTVVAVGRDGAGVIVERRFEPEGRISGETRVEFRWPE